MTAPDTDIAALQEALAATPTLALGPTPTIDRLGGLTNRVYRVAGPERAVVVRLPGDGTESYIDRAVEAHNARVAARAGVTPAVLHVDPAKGLLVTELVEAVTMTADLFKSRPGAPARAARAFRALHQSSEPFTFRFELFAMIDNYLKLLTDLKASVPDGYANILTAAQDVRAALDAHPAALAPCHCDPLCENFLDTGERMWLVDWEYSGQNDPLWDLGDLSVEGAFGPAEDDEMLHAYFDRAPTPAERGRVVIYKAMCDLLWTLWGLIQHAHDNPADDFWAYANTRFNRCRALMADPSFAGHVAAVRQG